MKKMRLGIVAASLLVLTFLGTAFVFVSEAESAETKWASYADKKFGFSVEYPDIFAGGETDQYVDGDGISNFSASKDNGKYAFTAWGGKKAKGATGNSILKEKTNMEEDDNGYVYGVEPIEGTAKSGADFYTLEYIDDSAGPEQIAHEYGVVGKTVTAGYSLRYPKEEAEKFAEFTKRMDSSLKAK